MRWVGFFEERREDRLESAIGLQRRKATEHEDVGAEQKGMPPLFDPHRHVRHGPAGRVGDCQHHVAHPIGPNPRRDATLHGWIFPEIVQRRSAGAKA